MTFGITTGFTAAAALALVALTAVGLLLGMPVWVAYLLAVNLLTLAAYGYDKTVAGSRRRRVPERVLHGLALAGGSPAALLAQRRFRHKTAKKSFQRVFWALLVLQTLALGYWLLR